jgi:hypothetical protein
MHIILLLLGVLCVAAGIAMVAWGIPDYPFEVGNALITRGTVAIVGGLVLVGLGSVISQLRRIRDAIETQQLAPTASAAPAAPPPDLAQAVIAEATRRPVAEPPRPEKAEASPAVASPLLDDTPQTASRETPGKPDWPRVDAADRFASRGANSATVEAPPLAEPDQPLRPGEPPAESVEPPSPAAKPTILKSGVLEGIPYTVYSDGSFEAEFPEGLMRFASFKELRGHFASRGIR